MLLRRFYDDALAQASYLIADTARGEALVVDPNRDVEPYVAAAAAEGVRITHVTETHIHADFVSGSRELARRTGAALLLSAEGGPDWQYRYAAADGARLLREGDVIEVGRIRVDVLHTPGHTPEHLTFLVTDRDAADRPMGACTGDFIFVGDVGRPDLLERAAKQAGTMAHAAGQLYRSLARMRDLPDYLQLWPGHGAGSACGKALGAVPQSTLGYERLFNWAFGAESEAAFVEQVLAGQPEPPKYFAEMKRINRDGPPVLGGLREPPPADPAALRGVLEGGAVVIDTRPTREYAAGAVPGTINIPLNKSFATWAGWLLPYDRDFYLIVDDTKAGASRAAARDLAMIGLERIAGVFPAAAVAAWPRAGERLQSIPQTTARELHTRLAEGDATLLDVRGSSEWEAGHIAEAHHIPLGYLADRLEEIPPGRPVVLQCQGGSRSAIAASLLAARGIRDVVNLTDGYSGWERAGLPVERG